MSHRLVHVISLILAIATVSDNVLDSVHERRRIVPVQSKLESSLLPKTFGPEVGKGSERILSFASMIAISRSPTRLEVSERKYPE